MAVCVAVIAKEVSTRAGRRAAGSLPGPPPRARLPPCPEGSARTGSAAPSWGRCGGGSAQARVCSGGRVSPGRAQGPGPPLASPVRPPAPSVLAREPGCPRVHVLRHCALPPGPIAARSTASGPSAQQPRGCRQNLTGAGHAPAPDLPRGFSGPHGNVRITSSPHALLP